MVYAVLLAGGLGLRVGSSVPKQHVMVDGRQLIEYTIEAFLNCDLIDGIVIVSNKAYMNQMTSIKNKYTKVIDVVEGGLTRIDSVQKSVIELEEIAKENDKIIISDAARPFITKKELLSLIDKLDSYSAATTYQPLNETLLRTSESRIEDIVYRDGCLRQTSPEAYLFSVLKRLYLISDRNVVSTYKNIGIDQLFYSGEDIGLVESTPFNFKITDEKDLELFKAFLAFGFERIINTGFCDEKTKR